MEGMRQMDEFKVLTAKLPSGNATVKVQQPLTVKLRDLKPDELDIFQLALGGLTAQRLIDSSRATDLAAATALLSLVERGYLAIG